MPAPTQPSHVSIKSSCDSFSGHFKNKISLIRSAFSDHTLNQVDSPQVNSVLASFTLATVDEVREVIMSSPNKSCDLDKLPTTLLKVCLHTLLYPITNIINASLCSGLFPDDLKQAQVNPLVKKSTLTKENINSYIPIPNLNFPSIVKFGVFTKSTDISYQYGHLAINVEVDIQKYVSKTCIRIIFSKK